MLFIAAFVFVYYTIWALLLVRSKFYLSSLSPSPPVLLFSIFLWTNSPTTSQPFLPPTSTIPSFFPPRSYAIKIPLFLLLAGICGVTLFFGRVMLAEARKKRVKGGKKV